MWIVFVFGLTVGIFLGFLWCLQTQKKWATIDKDYKVRFEKKDLDFLEHSNDSVWNKGQPALENINDNTWILVALCDDNGTVKDTILHRNNIRLKYHDNCKWIYINSPLI